MVDVLKTISTSRNSAMCDDIELRVTDTTKLVFRPEMVNNVRNSKASIKGTFIFLKKGPKGEWSSHQITNLARLRSGEGIKLELRSDEVRLLLEGIENYRHIHSSYGIGPGERRYVRTSADIEQIIRGLSQHKDLLSFADKLAKLEAADLQALDILVAASRIKKILDWWDRNQSCHIESSWQQFFTRYPWILTQIFPYVALILRDKAFVGGKGIDNRGGGIVDFLLTKELLDNVIIVEIKHPGTPLLSNVYREPDVYSVSSDLTGSINQVLSYRDTLCKECNQLRATSDQNFGVFNPCSVLIAETLDQLTTHGRKRSFELFRNDLKNIEIVTFDEVHKKLKYMFEIIMHDSEQVQLRSIDS